MAKEKKERLSLEELLEKALVKEEDRPYKVPENWAWSKIKWISEVCTGTTPSKSNPDYYGEKYPFFKPTDLEQGYNVLAAREFLSQLGVDKGRFIPKHSTLVTCIGATIGKCGFSRVDGSANQQINAMMPVRGISEKFIFWIINSPFMQESIINNASSTTLPILNKGRFEQLSIPLPPLAEQQRIVEVVESLFEKLDTAKELAQNALDSFENRKAAILHKACTGELTAKWRAENGVSLEEWEEKEFGKLGELERGRSKHRPRNATELFGGEYPFIQTGDVANSEVYVREHRQTLSEIGLKQSKLFPKGTLCITIAANIGDVAILSYDCCFPDSVVGFTPNNSVESKFIYYYMSVIKKQVEANAPATAQKNINLKILNDIKINTPSLVEQKEIVRTLDNLLENEQRAKELCDVIDKIDLMKKAILARAFRGELGTNDPEEESAVELLKEILKEKI